MGARGRLQAAHLSGPRSVPDAASSGPTLKAPGCAGGYLLGLSYLPSATREIASIASGHREIDGPARPFKVLLKAVFGILVRSKRPDGTRPKRRNLAGRSALACITFPNGSSCSPHAVSAALRASSFTVVGRPVSSTDDAGPRCLPGWAIQSEQPGTRTRRLRSTRGGRIPIVLK